MQERSQEQAHKVSSIKSMDSFQNVYNKLVKTLTGATTITGIAAGYGWVAKKVVKELMTSDSSANLMNYMKFTVVVATSLAAKQYLDDQKILPS